MIQNILVYFNVIKFLFWKIMLQQIYTFYRYRCNVGVWFYKLSIPKYTNVKRNSTTYHI
jgi:hypothetical protein